jgi:hypothetical protein
MQKRMRNKSLPILVIVLFMISLAAVTVSQAAPETLTLTGTIVTVSSDTGMVSIQDDSGKTVTLSAGADIDLTSLNGGDKVTVEYNSDMVIKSISKQG